MRSHLTAFGIGAGLAIVCAAALGLFAPKFMDKINDDDADGVHVINIGDDKSGSFHLREDGLNISAEWKGDFVFAADGRSLSSLDNRLEVRAKAADGEQKAVFTKRDGAIAAAYSVDGTPVEGEAGANGAAGLLQLFARTTSVNVDERVKAMLASGGKDRVLAEIGELKGGHALGAYIAALAAGSGLTGDEVKLLAGKVRGVKSDYAKRVALAALLGAPNLDDAATSEILDVAKTIEGDHELRLIVEELAERNLDARNFAVAAALIGDIESDHEVRLAVEALLESEHVDDATAAEALKIAASSIEGDYELRLAVEAAEERLDARAVADAALGAIGSIEGDHERRLAIELIASSLGAESPAWLSLVDLTAGIEDSRERRLAIEAISSAASADEAVRVALRKAASALDDQNERRLALDAVE